MAERERIIHGTCPNWIASGTPADKRSGRGYCRNTWTVQYATNPACPRHPQRRAEAANAPQEKR